MSAPVSSTVSTPSTATVTARSQAKLGGFFSRIAKTDLLSRSEDALKASKEAHWEAVATGLATLTTPLAGSTQRVRRHRYRKHRKELRALQNDLLAMQEQLEAATSAAGKSVKPPAPDGLLALADFALEQAADEEEQGDCVV